MVTQLTNSGGSVIKNYEYDAFGVEIGKDDNDTNPWRYCGEYWDEETGTIYLRARNYEPRTGRFSAEDPIRDGLNWYTYCLNNAIMYIDPLGLAYQRLRDLVYAIGGEVSWDANTKSATVTVGKQTKVYTIGVDDVYIDAKEDRMYIDGFKFARDFDADYKETYTKDYSSYEIKKVIYSDLSKKYSTVGVSYTSVYYNILTPEFAEQLNKLESQRVSDQIAVTSFALGAPYLEVPTKLAYFLWLGGGVQYAAERDGDVDYSHGNYVAGAGVMVRQKVGFSGASRPSMSTDGYITESDGQIKIRYTVQTN